MNHCAPQPNGPRGHFTRLSVCASAQIHMTIERSRYYYCICCGALFLTFFFFIIFASFVYCLIVIGEQRHGVCVNAPMTGERLDLSKSCTWSSSGGALLLERAALVGDVDGNVIVIAPLLGSTIYLSLSLSCSLTYYTTYATSCAFCCGRIRTIPRR